MILLVRLHVFIFCSSLTINAILLPPCVVKHWFLFVFGNSRIAKFLALVFVHAPGTSSCTDVTGWLLASVRFCRKADFYVSPCVYLREAFIFFCVKISDIEIIWSSYFYYWGWIWLSLVCRSGFHGHFSSAATSSYLVHFLLLPNRFFYTEGCNSCA